MHVGDAGHGAWSRSLVWCNGGRLEGRASRRERRRRRMGRVGRIHVCLRSVKENSEQKNRKAIMGIIICNINSYNPWYNIFSEPRCAHDGGSYLPFIEDSRNPPTHARSPASDLYHEIMIITRCFLYNAHPDTRTKLNATLSSQCRRPDQSFPPPAR